MSIPKEKKILINKRLKGLPRGELEKLSQKELLDKIEQLQAYNFQLRNVLQKKLNGNEKNDAEYKSVLQPDQKQMKEDYVNSDRQSQRNEFATRKFDFSKAHKRHVMLKLLYFGWDYQGFACQEDSNATIENYLFKALIRTCLIESRSTSNYHRCGRTDKEVSAYCQVISIDLRSKFPEEQQHTEEGYANEIDYCELLNRVLPKTIQCIAWMPLKNKEYSARFDCTARTYRYFFPKGDLNIEAMSEACVLLERHTDFRNFCKMDVHNGVTNYIRRVDKAIVQMCPNQASNNEGYTMYFLEIRANAFLWHQIRCIMAVLLLIGQGREEPSIISDLQDVEKTPCKPQYMPAIGLPLNLFNCEFRKRCTRQPNNEYFDEGETSEISDCLIEEDSLPESGDCDTTAWIYNEENLLKLIENVQSEWTQFSVKSTMISNVLCDLEMILSNHFPTAKKVNAQALLLQDCVKPRQYQKLLDRKRCESLENRIEHYIKKKRLIVRQAKTDHE